MNKIGEFEALRQGFYQYQSNDTDFDIKTRKPASGAV